MEFSQVTYHVELVAVNPEEFGYIWYVFKNLHSDPYQDNDFIACVRFPNWSHRLIEEGETGYLTVNYVIEGKTEWFDGVTLHKYNYTNCIFLKFVNDTKRVDNKNITVD